MKFLRFKKNEELLYGYLQEDKIVEIKNDFIQEPDFVETDSTYDLADVELISPVNPGKIIAIGLNYAKHAEEMGKATPEEPMIFMVAPTAVIGHGENIKLASKENRIDFEAELAIVVGKESYKLNEDNALEHIFGYTINNDVSDRSLQKKDGQFTRAKSYNTYKPLGPVIETELNPNNLNISLKVNGEVKQDSCTNDFIHNVEEVMVHITDVIPLSAGDVVITGTPSGVGQMYEGDVIEIEIEGVGKLINKVTY